MPVLIAVPCTPHLVLCFASRHGSEIRRPRRFYSGTKIATLRETEAPLPGLAFEVLNKAQAPGRSSCLLRLPLLHTLVDGWHLIDEAELHNTVPSAHTGRRVNSSSDLRLPPRGLWSSRGHAVRYTALGSLQRSPKNSTGGS
jgi:hypothetical protein